MIIHHVGDSRGRGPLRGIDVELVDQGGGLVLFEVLITALKKGKIVALTFR